MTLAYRTAALFLFLCAVLIPFPYDLVPFWERWLNALLSQPMAYLGDAIGFRVSQAQVTSDSATMYMLVFSLLPVALLAVLVVKRFQKSERWLIWIKTFLTFFLSLHLMSYGCDKLFKGQFYLPEPNILFTEFGQLDKDILFWSTLGTSYTYSFFTGLIEVGAALLLWFRKTRVLGLFMALGAMFHVVLINFSFDISVKLFSTILLSISLFVLLPYLKGILQFFAGKPVAPLSLFKLTTANGGREVGLKIFAVGFIVFEAIYPNLVSGNWNDDVAPRPYLHGAYQVENWSEGMPERVFIHRQGFLITQMANGEIASYELRTERFLETMIVTMPDGSTDFCYPEFNDKGELLSFRMDGRIILVAPLNWRNLPALRPAFHWTVDEVGHQ